jgi:hypothetical protein
MCSYSTRKNKSHPKGLLAPTIFRNNGKKLNIIRPLQTVLLCQRLEKKHYRILYRMNKKKGKEISLLFPDSARIRCAPPGERVGSSPLPYAP